MSKNTYPLPFNQENLKLNDMSSYFPELPKDLPILVTKYCSGRFYFLSTNSVKCLLSKRESYFYLFLFHM